MPDKVKADFVGTSPFTDSVYVFDPSWNVLSRKAITLSGFTVLGATSVTWNSDDLLFYAIVRTSTPDRRLVTIDPATGICTDIGDLGGNFSSITYSSTDGIICNGLGYIDPISGRINFVHVLNKRQECRIKLTTSLKRTTRDLRSSVH
ncbi:MAG: hypothetical protein IPM38_01385 [Ignavibacteria bacterium]|nr:hypothetical protein [Ignavibacteria bacterium]